MPPPPGRLTEALSDRYTLQGEIGSGGMATVYRGRDIKHERDVAIKVLRPELAAVLGPDRFLREIRIAAQLHHPHVLQLFDSGTAGERDGGTEFLYYTMPLIEGESLRQRIAREGELPLGEAMRILRDVADALSHAHSRGLVHRDIKPDNVLLSGRHALVTDFGVAKALTNSTTSAGLTSAGVALGTPAYMSPEQASGLPDVDHRADIYAFGVMAYETLSGELPITGENPQQVLAKQVTEEPRPLSGLRETVPPGVAALVMRCLAKKPADRWQTMDEVLYHLEVLATPSGGMTPTSARLVGIGRPATRWRTVIGALGAVVALAALGVLAIYQRGGPGAAAASVQRQVTFFGDVELSDVSPNGEFLAYSTATDSGVGVYVRDLASGSSITLTRNLGRMAVLRWTPDGRHVLAVGVDDTGEIVHLLFPRLGGSPTPLSGRFGILTSWSADGSHRFLWATNFQGFNVYSDDDGASAFVWMADSATSWLYDVEQHPVRQDVFAVSRTLATGNRTTIYHVEADSLTDWMQARETERRAFDTQVEILVEEDDFLGSPRWAPDGRALFYLRLEERAFDLWMLPVDEMGRAAGEPVPTMRGLEVPIPTWTGPHMSFTSDGTQLFLTQGVPYAHLWEVASSPSGDWTPRQLTTGTAINQAPVASPDGTRLAFVRVEGGRSNVFSMAWGGGPPQQMTHVDSVVGNVAWSPDGDAFAFGLRRDGHDRVAMASMDRPENVRVFQDTELSGTGNMVWAPGEDILYPRPIQGNNSWQYQVLDPTSGEEREFFPADTANLGWPLSVGYAPDASALAVGWNRLIGTDDGLWVISLADSVYRHVQIGGLPMIIGWSPDGRAVYTLAFDGREIWRVPLDAAPQLLVSSLPFSPSPLGTTVDGSSFVLGQEGTVADVWVIENFDPRGR